MPRLRRVNHQCSRTLSDTANMSRHGSTLCSPTIEKLLCRSPIFEAVTCRQSAPDPQGKGEKIRGWKPQVSTLLCARAASAHSPLRFSEKLSARQGRTRLRQFEYPAQPVPKKPPARFAFPPIPLCRENEKGTAHAVPLPSTDMSVAQQQQLPQLPQPPQVLSPQVPQEPQPPLP